MKQTKNAERMTAKNKVVSLLLALIVLLIGIVSAITVLPSAGSAHALEGYDIDVRWLDKDIYYFTDYYPTLDSDVMFGTSDDDDSVLSGYTFTIDHKYIDKYEFSQMVFNGYFDDLDNDEDFDHHKIVIIDIKTFMPDPQDLTMLFKNFKERECLVIFVSLYSENDYRLTFPDVEWLLEYYDFFPYVDLFIQDSEMLKLETFVALTIWETRGYFGYDEDYEHALSKQTHILDGNLVRIDKYLDDFFDYHYINLSYYDPYLYLTDYEYYEGELPDMNTLCADSQFLKRILYWMCKLYEIPCEMNGSEIDYNSVAESLKEISFDEANHYDLLVHYRDNILVDILNWRVYVIEDFTAIDYDDYNHIFDFRNDKQVVFIGFWRFRQDLYKNLWEYLYGEDYSLSQEQEFTTKRYISIYLLQVDPVGEGINPLYVTTYKTLFEIYEDWLRIDYVAWLWEKYQVDMYENVFESAESKLYNGLVDLLTPKEY